ncbi:MAG: hypothetical protein ACK41T_04825 [Pseudobdellovibrio sp.]
MQKTMTLLLPKALTVILCFFSFSAFASEEDQPKQVNTAAQFDEYYNYTFKDYASLLRQRSLQPADSSCATTYTPFIQDGVLNTVIAFGYLDHEAITTTPQIDNTGYNYGPIRVSDRSMFLAVKNNLTADCKYKNDNLCGFNIISQSSNTSVLSKSVLIHDQQTEVRITMAHPSVTDSHVLNETEYKQQQLSRSQQVEDLFKYGLEKGDVTFYIGHSRDGGGPDFFPPILRKDMHVNYSLYQSKKTGLNTILKSLSGRQDNHSILGLFSCSSKRHFESKILNVKPNKKMILSNDLVYFSETLEAALGYLGAFMRGYCGPQLKESALQSDRTKYGFADYNL